MKNIVKTFAIAAFMLVSSASTFADVNIIDPTSKYDLNGDGEVSAADVEELYAAIEDESTDIKFDLNGDGEVSAADVEELYAYLETLE